MVNKNKECEKEFMKEFIKSSKVWGFGFYFGGIICLAIPISILISKDINILIHSIILGIILILVGIYFLARYERDFF